MKYYEPYQFLTILCLIFLIMKINTPIKIINTFAENLLLGLGFWIG